MSVQAQNILSSISSITTLCKELPMTISHGSKRCKIYEVLSGPEGENAWHTFNQQFDALFGEDCRDEEGRLHHIRRGEYGIDKVIKYLSTIDLGSLSLDLVDIKLNRLKEELEFLSWVSLSLKITEILNCLSLGLRIRRKLLLHLHFYQIT